MEKTYVHNRLVKIALKWQLGHNFGIHEPEILSSNSKKWQLVNKSGTPQLDILS
jgi:hypothetical protein